MKLYYGPNVEIDIEKMIWIHFAESVHGGKTMHSGPIDIVNGRMYGYLTSIREWRPFPDAVQKQYQSYVDQCLEETLLGNKK
jgi:hypothetical protein